MIIKFVEVVTEDNDEELIFYKQFTNKNFLEKSCIKKFNAIKCKADYQV